MNNKKHGYGELYWNDGRCFRGKWRDNKMHGFGIVTNRDGQSKKGEWVNGKLLRWISDEEAAELDFGPLWEK